MLILLLSSIENLRFKCLKSSKCRSSMSDSRCLVVAVIVSQGGSNFGEFGLAYYDVVPPFQAEEGNVEL